jgi:RNA polymerase sigma-70 factor (ECF subfamily)
MNELDRHNLFSDLISRHHTQLYAYIFAVVRNREDAADVFQSMCVVLWRRFESFEPGSEFFPWARQTAKLVARGFLRHKKVRATGSVSEDLLDALAETTVETQNTPADLSLAALRRCKSKLSDSDGELLELRYGENLSSGQIADRTQRPQPSVCNSLKRIRGWLLDCIQMELARQEHPGEGSP